MNRLSFYIAFLFIFLSKAESLSQVKCTVPVPPVFTSVDIDPETGDTYLQWQLSPSDSIAAYIVYAYRDDAGFPVDTLWDPAATSYSYITNAWRYFSVSYTITAFRLPDCESPLSNVLSTIFLETDFNACDGTIELKWTRYQDYPKRVTGYSILVSRNDGPMVQTYNLPGSASDTLIKDFEINSGYCFVVRAELEDGTTSRSNKACVTTPMQRPPSWINADYATVTEKNEISLSFTIDPLSEIQKFMLERKTGMAGMYQAVTTIAPSGGRVVYTDGDADITEINYYRLSAINNCDKPVAVSNTASNIVLSIERRTEDLVLSWNSLHLLEGSSISYRLYMDSGNGFNPVATINADSVFVILLKDIIYEIASGEVCFYLAALESGNANGINGESISSRACTKPDESITVPNVFTPNNDLRNDSFRPVLSFTPQEYSLVISDRQGRILFETNDFMDEWDGSGSAGGVFLWHLKLTTPSGKSITRTGTVTIFIP